MFEVTTKSDWQVLSMQEDIGEHNQPCIQMCYICMKHLIVPFALCLSYACKLLSMSAGETIMAHNPQGHAAKAYSKGDYDAKFC